MSLYTFATENLTTTADRRRRPTISSGQLLRTVALFLVAFLALALVARSGHAADAAARATVAQAPA